eukprot:4983823-Pleurochrysis_carterae.AAC.1
MRCSRHTHELRSNSTVEVAVAASCAEYRPDVSPRRQKLPEATKEGLLTSRLCHFIRLSMAVR